MSQFEEESTTSSADEHIQQTSSNVPEDTTSSVTTNSDNVVISQTNDVTEDNEHPKSIGEQMYLLVRDVLALSEDNADITQNDAQLTLKLNIIAEMLEEAEADFRKNKSTGSKREDHTIGRLFHIIDDQHGLYIMMEEKLLLSVDDGLISDGLKAAMARVFLASVPNSPQLIVYMLYEEEMLDRICRYATEKQPPLRSYATGVLSVALRNRGTADAVVKQQVPLKLLKHARLFALKLDKERQQAMRYMQGNLKIRAKHNSNRSKKTASHQTEASNVSIDMSHKSRHSTDRDTISSPSTILPSPVRDISDANNESESGEALTAPLNTAVNFGADVLSSEHEEEMNRVVMLELLYTLDCVGYMGEYSEIFASAMEENIVESVMIFLHSKNMTLLSSALKLTSRFLAHRKFALSLVDVGGVALIASAMKMQQEAGQLSILDRSISMCLHGCAYSTAVIERILLSDRELRFVQVAFELLSSPNIRARHNAVVFFGLCVEYKVVLDYFEKHDGLYVLLNIIQLGNTLLKSSLQRQLACDACLCLRQYFRVHLSLLTHRVRRKLAQSQNSSTVALPLRSALHPVPMPSYAALRLPIRVAKLSSYKPLDINDKAHEQNLIVYERYRLAALGKFTTEAQSQMGPISVAGIGASWPPAAKFVHLRGIPVMLEVASSVSAVIQVTEEHRSEVLRGWMAERAQFCLEVLRILTLVVPSLSHEVCSTEIAMPLKGLRDTIEGSDSVASNEAIDQSASTTNSSATSTNIGISILLGIAMSNSARDSDLVRDVLHVICNCLSPPHSEDCWQHPQKELQQFPSTMRHAHGQIDMPLASPSAHPDPNSSCCGNAGDDKLFRPIRRLAREKNAIKVCVQLLQYKRSVKNADVIRLLATYALLGLARDRHVAQILEKMQLGQLLSDLVREEPILEENADVHVRFREAALYLISQATERTPTTLVTMAIDPTVRKIDKANIVAQTKITYDSTELLRLVQDHLIAQGYHHAADALAEEANLPHRSQHKSYRQGLKQGCRKVEASSRRGRRAVTDVLNRKRTREQLVDIRKRARLSPTKDALDHQDLNQQAGTKDTCQSPVAISRGPPHAQQRKRIREAMRSKHYFNTRPSQKLWTRAKTSPPQQSQLDLIITNYLREQHRQCINPVTTVPPFRLYGKNLSHHCPNPSSLKAPSRFGYASYSYYSNINTRIKVRDRVGVRFGACAFSDPYLDAGINRYLYSRYRPYRVANADSPWFNIASAKLFYDKSDKRGLVLGNCEGDVQVLDVESDSVVQEWQAHSRWSLVTDLVMHPGIHAGQSSRSLLTGCIGLPMGKTEVAVWDLSRKEDEMLQWQFDGARCPALNHYGDQLAVLDVLTEEERARNACPTRLGEFCGALILDYTTGQRVASFKDSNLTNDYDIETNVSFSYDDHYILTDGILWDARASYKAIRKFDKLSDYGSGVFHPNQNEVIINSAVWDLRTYRLLRMVQALDECKVEFNSQASVMFVYYPHKVGGSDAEHLKSRRHNLQTYFRVLDARDYREITTVELNRKILDLSIDPEGAYLSVVEGKSDDDDESFEPHNSCRLYEIGRRRATEDDPDADEQSDTVDETDSMEYASGTEDDSDLDSDQEFSDNMPIEVVMSDDMDGFVEIEETDNEAEGEIDSGDDDTEFRDRRQRRLSSRQVRALLELPTELDMYQLPHSLTSDEEDEDEEDNDA